MNAPGDRHGFWSTTATDDWEQALITGNGRQGALVYGRPGRLLVTLSHERLRLPVDEPLPAPATARILPGLRESLLAGRFQEAAVAVTDFAAAEDPRYARLRWIDPLVGAATLTLTGSARRVGHQRTVGYRRGVDFGTGVAYQRFDDVCQRVFVSRADDVVAVRVSAGGRRFRLRARLGPIAGSPPVPIETTSTVTPDGLVFAARFPTAWPGAIAGYTVVCRVIVAGGAIRPGSSGDLHVGRTREALFLLRTVVDGDPDETLESLRALPTSFDTLLAAHERQHRPLMERCSLRLGAPPAAEQPATEQTSDELLRHLDSPALVQRLFDAGRYAIISSTGELPPTLQGVWSGTYRPAWASGVTLDGNVYAALAALAPTGTPELLVPFFDLLDTHMTDFRENARRLYDAPGILLPPHVSTHGRHNHFGPTWCLTFWTAGAAWAARIYEEHLLHTGDTELWERRALPFLREAREFYTAFAPTGRFVPSYSPENAPAHDAASAMADPSQAAINATMDVAAVRSLLRALGEPVDHLPPFQIAADGTMAEWLWPGLEPQHAHRHASHLYPLWYEPDRAILDDPALRAAAVRTVEARLAWWRDNGDEMAFGLVQLGLAAAALGLAATCHEIVTRLAGTYWRPNLVSTHNAGAIFNVDICGGFPALIVAMLVSSAPPRPDQPGRLDLLPALSSAWADGEIRGVLTRAAVRIERLAWSPERIELTARAATDTTVALGAPPAFGPSRRLDLPAGKTVDVCLVSRKTNSRALSPSAGAP